VKGANRLAVPKSGRVIGWHLPLVTRLGTGCKCHWVMTLTIGLLLGRASARSSLSHRRRPRMNTGRGCTRI